MENDKEDQKKLLRLFREGNVDKGLEEITQMLIDNNKDGKIFNKKLGDLYNYFSSNLQCLIPYKLRKDIKLPIFT